MDRSLSLMYYPRADRGKLVTPFSLKFHVVEVNTGAQHKLFPTLCYKDYANKQGEKHQKPDSILSVREPLQEPFVKS